MHRFCFKKEATASLYFHTAETGYRKKAKRLKDAHPRD